MSETLSLVEQVKAAMKAAMKAREKETLSTIRLIQAEFKRVEVDERIEIDDARPAWDFSARRKPFLALQTADLGPKSL